MRNAAQLLRLLPNSDTLHCCIVPTNAFAQQKFLQPMPLHSHSHNHAKFNLYHHDSTFMLPVSRCHICASLSRSLSHAAAFIPPLSGSLSHVSALVQPLSSSSIYGTTFTLPHLRLHIHAALLQLHSRCRKYAAALTQQHFFAALMQQHCCNLSHAAALTQHLTRSSISVVASYCCSQAVAFSPSHLRCSSRAAALRQHCNSPRHSAGGRGLLWAYLPTLTLRSARRLRGKQGLAGEGWGEGVEKGRSGVEWGWMLHTSLSAKEVCDHTVTEG